MSKITQQAEDKVFMDALAGKPLPYEAKGPCCSHKVSLRKHCETCDKIARYKKLKNSKIKDGYDYR